MSEKYPLYPKLSEEGEKEAQLLLDSFKEKLKKIADEVLGNLYCDVACYIESDSWTNFRNELLDGLRNYNNRKIQGEYDFEKIRQSLYKEFRDDIINDLNQDLVKENEQLKKQIENLSESLRSRYY